jgi:hypothetical protein
MRMRREPTDDLLHRADDDPNYNESRYYNFSEPDGGLGGWVRMGNRPNEGYAELTVCLYLPDGRVGFIFKRPHIDTNVAHDAGGLRFDVIAPYEEHHVTYDGQVCVLANPRDMADPGTAFKENPHVDCTVDLHLRAAAPPTGGEREYDEGEEPPPGLATSFARGHTEQQMTVTGVVQVDGAEYHLDHGLGLRDHSWGPRVWQSIWWYRWVTASFPGFGIGATLRGEEHDATIRHSSGYVFDRRSGELVTAEVRDIQLETEYDDAWFPVRNHAVITTDRDDVYELHGEIWSAIPLRNRRDGKITRISESMTRWRCGDARGAGLTEYLDQVVDGTPVGVGNGG